MVLKISVYYRNEKTKKFEIFHKEVTDKDIEQIVKDKCEPLPHWMDDNWSFDSATVENVEL